MKKVSVNTISKSYNVFIDSFIFESLPDFIKEYNLSKRTFIILDKKIELIYGSVIKKVINALPGEKYSFSIKSSEGVKSFRTARQIFSKLSEEKFARDTLIIAIGGGTIGDVTGFVASTYMRGVSLVHIPTTLLSAIDSSIGGKTAINFRTVKNLIGTFYQPSFVIVDTNFFKSLSQKELVSGFGEVIKYSYLTDGKFYSNLLSNYDLLMSMDLNLLNKVAYECIKIKSAVVSKDEQDLSGLRKILNFGHTFAHAFESNSLYRLSHGKAVIAGIVSALFLSFKKGLINKKQLDHMIDLPLKFKSSIQLRNFEEKEIFKLMSYDKKNKKGDTQFVLIKNFGEIIIDLNANEKEIYWALDRTKKLLV